MNLKTFYELYDLNDATITSIYNSSADLIIEAELEIYQEFMANGFRPDFNFTVKYQFIFKNIIAPEIKNTPLKLMAYTYKNDCLSITINDVLIQIPQTEVTVIRKDG